MRQLVHAGAITQEFSLGRCRTVNPVRGLAALAAAATAFGLFAAAAPADAQGIGSMQTFSVGTAPTGVAVDQAGNAYISDNNSSWLTVVRPNGTVNAQFAYVGAHPTTVVTDSSGEIYVATDKGVEHVHPDGASVLFAATSSNPTGITTDANGDVFVAAWPTLTEYDATGAQVTSVSTGTTESVAQLATDTDGNVYAVYSGGNHVDKLDVNGVWHPDFFVDDSGTVEHLAADTNDTIYATDTASSILWRLHPDGAAFAKAVPNGMLAGPIAASPDGQVYFTGNSKVYAYADQVNGQFDPNGGYPASTGTPLALAVGSSGNVWQTQASPNQAVLVSIDTRVPTAPTVNVVSANTNSAVVSVSPDPASSPATTFTVTTDGGQSCTINASFTPYRCTLTGLASDTDYQVTATATNVNGTSDPSDSVTLTTAHLPTAPGAPAVDLAGGDHQVTATITPSDQGDPATSYSVTVQPSGGTCTVAADAPSLSCDVTGLAADTDYTATATATNAVGTSPVSDPSAVAHTDRDAPSAPTGVTVAVVNGTTVNVTFTSADNLATQFTASAAPSVQTCTVITQSSQAGDVHTCTIYGLTQLTTYQVTVTASNEVGDSNPTAPVTVKTPQATPNAPHITAVVPGDGEVTVTVAASTGPTVTSTVVTVGSRTCTVTGANGTCAVTGLVDGTGYQVSAVSRNSYGSSPRATAAAVVPLRAFPTRLAQLASTSLTGTYPTGDTVVSMTGTVCGVSGTRLAGFYPGTCRVQVRHGATVVRTVTVTVSGSTGSTTTADSALHHGAVLFNGTSATLSTSAKKTLAGDAASLRKSGVVAVFGYSGAGRVSSSAKALAAKRAAAVASYLRALKVKVTVVSTYTTTSRMSATASRRADFLWL